MAGRRIDERFEDFLEEVFDAVRLRLARRRARSLLHVKAYLRGHACHCPDDQPVHLVHSEGLREGADVVVDYGSNVGSARRRQLPVESLAKIAGEIGGGDVVHVKAELLGAFLEHVMPRIGGPFVLVTGDSDYPPVAAHRALLDDRRVIHWFAQNCDVATRHPRLTRIPIGFDNPHYSKLDKRLGFALAMLAGKTGFDPGLSRNDMGDQQLFSRILAEPRRAFRDKPATALCTFHMNQKFIPNFRDVPERVEAHSILHGSPACHFVTRRLPQAACWREHERHAFEVSPRGKGLDCFRTWEALALDCVPIVKSSSLDPLYQDERLPVVIVESFAEITPDRLRRWQTEHADAFGPELLRRLSNDYWLQQILAKAEQWRLQAATGGQA